MNFKIKYRFYSEDEGGRKKLPYQGYRSDFFYNEKAFPFLKEAGYLTATTTKEGSLVSENNLYEIKRIRPGILTGQNLLDYLEKIN